jgi:hypothetical protein
MTLRQAEYITVRSSESITDQRGEEPIQVDNEDVITTTISPAERHFSINMPHLLYSLSSILIIPDPL